MHVFQHQELTYREGSLFWQMNSIATQFCRESLADDFDQLDNTQRQILNVLKLNEEALGTNELELMKQLEERLPRVYGNSNGAGFVEETLEKPVQQTQKRPAPDQRDGVVEVKSEQQVIPFLSQVSHSI